MKIVLVSHLVYPYFIGGVEKYVYYTAKELTRIGHTVEIFSTDPTGKFIGEKKHDGIIFNIFRSYAPNGIYYFSPELLNALLKLKNVDVIHSNAYGTFAVLAAVIAKKINGVPTIVQTHLAAPKAMTFLHNIYNPTLGNLILNDCDRIIMVSKAEFFALRLLRGYESKTNIVSNSVDFNKVNKYYSDSNIKLKSNELKILCVSRLEPMKGIDQAIRIVKEVLPFIKLRMTIVGEGSKREYLEHLSKKLSLNNQIKFSGRISESKLYDLYSTSDIFLSLSNYESNSISLIEAMSFGVVPIATAVGGNRYLIDNQRTGFLISHPVIFSEVKKLLKILSTNYNLLTKLKYNVRIKALNEFNLKKNTEQLVEIYKKIKIH